MASPPCHGSLAAQFGIANTSKTLIENGCHIRSIFHISSQYVKLAQSLLDIGEDIRHVEHYEGVFFLVADKQQSISSIHVNVEELSLADHVVAFWSEAPTYAEYLLSHFDQAWAQGVDAKTRIQELQQQGLKTYKEAHMRTTLKGVFLRAILRRKNRRLLL